MMYNGNSCPFDIAFIFFDMKDEDEGDDVYVALVELVALEASFEGNPV